MKKRRSSGREELLATILADAKQEAAAILQNEYEYGAAHTESPIERILLAQFLHPMTAREFDTRVGIIRPRDGMVGKANPPPFSGIYVYPQITIGDYRVDFFLACVGGMECQPLIVECDGHDFHEKTKEQARRDKARDRYLVGQGYRVLRFTGSEIYNDPSAVATEAIAVLLGVS